MIVCRTAAELERALERRSAVGFVPTMGAFHEGHLSLMRASKQECERTVVSLFVNPLQFGHGEDFERYPRDEQRDFELAASVGVDVMLCPQADEIYQGDTRVSPGSAAREFEGALRPGHFEGVCTVVAKLFNLVRPEKAYFGLKDLQQCAVIAQMVRDLFMPLSLRLIETVREPGGLAMSSRNAYLTDSQRDLATNVHRILCLTADAIRSGCGPHSALEDGRSRFDGLGIELQYLTLVDPLVMREVSVAESTSRVVFAGKIAAIRLIDNVPVFPGAPFLELGVSGNRTISSN